VRVSTVFWRAFDKAVTDPFVRHEAVLSSRIEGTLATEEELLLFEVNPSSEAKTPDVREVANYVRALEYGFERMKELPFSLRLIRELHERLLEGVRGVDRRPSSFRTIQNYITEAGAANSGRTLCSTAAY